MNHRSARWSSLAALLFVCSAHAQTPARTVTLDEALAAAREHQPQLRQAHATTQAATARADEARSGLLPQVSATAGYQRTTANAIGRPGSTPLTGGGGGTFDNYNFFSTGITVNQLIYDFGQTSDKWHAQEANAQATAQTEKATALQIDLNVRATYFSARANRSLVAVAHDSVANVQKHLEQTEEFVKAGTHPEIDLYQGRSDLANAQLQLINAENNYSQSRAQLNQAMGVEGPIDYDVVDQSVSPVDGESSSPTDLMAEATKARPEMASVEEQVHAQELTRKSIEGQYGPSIGASAGFSQGGTALDKLGWNAQIGVSLTWFIYQGGVTNASVRESEATIKSLQAQADTLRQQIRLQLEQVLLAVRAAKASLGAAHEAQANAKVRLELAEGRYQAGVGNAIELSDAQVALTTASAQVVSADFQLATARAQLMQALGRT
jgi:outer membrane protein